jgi:nucleoid-associated protein YgaU
MVLVAGHVFAQTSVDDMTNNLTGNFILYERYLPNTLLNQLRAVRNRLISRPDESAMVIDAMQDFIVECDNTAYQNVLVKLSEMGKKDERLSSYQSRYEVQELHQRFLTLNQRAQISFDEIRNDVNAIESLYDALDQQYADLVVLSGIAESTYVVQTGDSLRGIASRLYGTGSRWNDIYALNRDIIQNPDFILPNMVLRLPVSEAQQSSTILSDPYSGQSLAAATRVTPSSNSYYVKAGGNDANNGFTEDTAFKTLAQAVQAAASGSIKTITVLGRLEINSERDIIKDTGAAEITITGSATAPAILTPWDLFCSVLVQGNSNIRFEQITIRDFDNGGLVVQDATVTLGAGARITANNSYGGGGLRIKNGKVIMQNGSEIVNNEYSEVYENMGGYGAGVELDGGSLTMMEGSRIAGNIAHGVGGGVYISAGSFVMRGGSISGNQSKRARGGGVYVAGGSFEISGGEISGNIGNSGDAVYIAQTGSFSNRGGMIATAIVDERAFSPISPIVPPAASLARYDSHTIQPGEYLRMIAARVYGDETRWPEIYRANLDNIADPDFILANSVLQIPRPEVSEPLASMLGITQAPAQSTSAVSQPPILAGISTYYVRASGNDTNSGLSETESFKTLTRALNAASGSSIKKVTVIGTLEMTDIDTPTIQNTGADEIIISGKSSAGETATLRRRSNPLDSQWWKTLTISGNSNIRFEYITISGGTYGGLVIQDATVTLGPGARVRDNTSAYGGGGGVYIANGKLTMLDGAEISNNASMPNDLDERVGYGGGVVLESGSFTMMGGTITGNTAETVGGGVYVEGGSFVLVNGRITGNSSRFAGGAVYVAGGSFVMTGAGVVSHNIAQYGGGVYVEDGTSVMINGSIAGNTGDYGDAVYVGLKGSFRQLGGSIQGAQENTSVIDAANLATTGSGRSSYYVSAKGNDANEGTRENSALRTMAKALELVKQSNVKVITVIGTLEGTTRIENMGGLEILITGKAQASEAEKAVFKSTSTEPAFDISGQSRIRVEHITVSTSAGGAFRIRDREASLTLGTKTRILGTPDTVTVGVALENDATLIMCDDASISDINASSSAVYVAKGTFTMTDSALIARNSTQADGGGVHIRDGVFTMQGSAKIAGNKSGANGGGVCIDQGSFSMQENALISDNTALGYGGGVFMNQVSQEMPSFTMRGMALISGNTATNLGGGVYIIGQMSLWGNTRISDNTALSGGGVAISANSSLSLWEDTKITANRSNGADNFGGGVLGLDKTSRITLSGNAVLSGNIADYGGGAATFGTIAGETNIAITANRALKGGGGVVFLFKNANDLQEEKTDQITTLFEKVHGNIAPGDPKEADIALRQL